jgi:hypothetical protein
MGEKRVSCREEVMAYEERPVAMGRASKVPMQPRRERDEEVSLTRFQVTKRGDSEMADERWEVRRGCKPTGTKDGGVLAAVSGERLLEEAEELTEDEEREAVTRWSAGRRGCKVEDWFEGVNALFGEGMKDEGGSSSVSSFSSADSSSSRPLG